MHLLQDGADLPLRVIQPLGQRDRVILCADHAMFARDKPFRGVFSRRDDEPRLVVVQIIQIRFETIFYILHRLRPRLGDMHLVRSTATAMNNLGEVISSHPAE